MPPKCLKTTKEIIDTSRPIEQLKSLKCMVGSNYEATVDLIKVCEEHFTATSKFTDSLNPKYNKLFDNLLECFPYRKDIKVVSIDVQRTGCDTTDYTHYPMPTREYMRILVVLKERGYSNFDLILEERHVTIPVIEDGLYPLPQQMSELSISSRNTTKDGGRVKACKCIYINFIVRCLNDNPRAYVGDKFIGVEQKNGTKGMLDKFAKLVEEKQLDKKELAQAVESLG